MNIPEKIKKCLNTQGKTQTWLSKQTNISPPKLSAALNGKRKINVDEFDLIIKALNVDANEFYENNRS